MPDKPIKGSKNRLASFGHAINGIKLLLKEEPNARIHFTAAIFVILFSYFLNLSTSEWLWIVLSIAFVFTAELFNTAIENICDYISPQYHEKIKVIKDLSAGAVLFVSLFALFVAFFILIPKLFLLY